MGTGKPSYMQLTFYFYWTMLFYAIGPKDQEYPIYTNLDVINIRDKCYKFSSRRMDFHRRLKKIEGRLILCTVQFFRVLHIQKLGQIKEAIYYYKMYSHIYIYNYAE